ncbi:hypothetical protein SSX86_015870 [Deinandra increscens subsp. villosa]|uniref:RRM domain-containing protein n=1 Tax=Deinandra increscens subsp. villosa TaxID=3103831 RepID=A0AAP0D168_9ASTR
MQHRRRSTGGRSPSRQRERDNWYPEDKADRDRSRYGRSRVREGRAGFISFSRVRAGRDDRRHSSRVRVQSDDDHHGFDKRGQSTRFYNTNYESFSHGEFDKNGFFHEYEQHLHGNEDKDWHRVTNRKEKYRYKSSIPHRVVSPKGRDPRWDDVDKWSNTLFITNFPPGVTEKGIYDSCGKIGKVVDVFLPNRVSAVGKRFAFVRFAKGLDVSNLIYKIRNFWIGPYRLFADISKFKRGDGSLHGTNLGNSLHGAKPTGENSPHLEKEVTVASNIVVSKGEGTKSKVPLASGNSSIPVIKENPKVWKPKSFLGAVTGAVCIEKVTGSSSFATSSSNSDHSLDVFMISKSKQVPLVNFASSLILKVRDINSLSKVYLLARLEGFSKVKFRYIGGLWIRADCSSLDESVKFANCDSFKSIYQNIQRVTNNTFTVDERVVWIEIAGLPLGAWSSDIFSAIASNWGKVCFIDNDIEEPLSSGKVCILAQSHKRIHEFISCVMDGVKYDVSVNEYQHWSPTFDCPLEENDSSDDEFSDSDLDLKDNMSRDAHDVCFNQVNVNQTGEEAVIPPTSHGNENQVKSGVNSDPFGIMDYINKLELNKNYSISLSVPPGFERIVNDDEGVVNKGPPSFDAVATSPVISVSSDAAATSPQRSVAGNSNSKVTPVSGFSSGADAISSLSLRSNLEDIELAMELGSNLDTLNAEKLNILDDLYAIENKKHMEISQKIKSKWVLEGDENSKFFHALLKKRRRTNSVRGIKVDGVWVDSPDDIKAAFFEYHASRFKACGSIFRPDLSSLSFKKIDQGFPRLFALENHKECKVSDRIIGNICCWSWRRDIRGGVESIQRDQLFLALDSFSASSGGDFWGWDFDGSKEFVVSRDEL